MEREERMNIVGYTGPVVEALCLPLVFGEPMIDGAR